MLHRDGSRILLYSTGGDCYIERNIFINAGNIQVTDAHDTYIRNNVFYEQIEVNILDGGNSTGQTYVQYNSFLSTDRVALKLAPYVSSAEMVAINNFWNTTDAGIIDSMIYDRNDDLNVSNYIEYIPFRTAPHPDTPIPDFNQAPIADCGDDQVVFDEVILDGSDSYDPDGSIEHYNWTLQHEDGTIINATGINPTIDNLPAGYFNVSLMVTDDGGLSDTDSMILAAAGPCEDLDQCLDDLEQCQDDTEQCNIDLSQCNDDLIQLSGDLATCNENLGQCDDNLSACQIDSEQCNSDLTQCSENLSQTSANLEMCNANVTQLQEELDQTKTELEQALADLAAATSDTDGDGVLDLIDACPGTFSSAAVDQIGCSLSQFCAAIDTNIKHGKKMCDKSDWRNDEPLENKGDCEAIKQGKGPSNYR